MTLPTLITITCIAIVTITMLGFVWLAWGIGAETKTAVRDAEWQI